MKTAITIILALCIISAIGITARGETDVNDSFFAYYDDPQTGVTVPYRLILPEDYQETGIYPLVVYLHGAGERGMDGDLPLSNGCVQNIAENMPDAIVLVPQCTHRNQWVDVPWEQGSYRVESVPESEELAAVMKLLKQTMETYSVDRDRIYAAGYSMGGYGVWDLMVRHNDVFAAGVAVCGGGDPSQGELLKQTPMFVYHGESDSTVPCSGSQETVDAIRAAGGTKVSYTAYPDTDHRIWQMVFAQESLYEELKQCRLSDRYPTEVTPSLPPTEPAPTQIVDREPKPETVTRPIPQKETDSVNESWGTGHTVATVCTVSGVVLIAVWIMLGRRRGKKRENIKNA